MKQSSNRFIKLTLWFIAACLVVALVDELFNAPSTIAAISGLLILAAWIVITMESACFTKIHFKKSKKSTQQ